MSRRDKYLAELQTTKGLVEENNCTIEGLQKKLKDLLDLVQTSKCRLCPFAPQEDANNGNTPKSQAPNQKNSESL